MLIVIYLLYVKLSETIHINRLLGGRHLFLLNKAEKSHSYTDITSLYPGACELVFGVVADAHTMFP
ncbi:hypothetical protein [Kiloniella sp.]|uniref:hypothetical protein n=1 Tax=Kiloniella sp. TaxID=1938587 RepID=UPI003B012CF8